ncbi:MAG: lycopene beta-cyclase CrtY [Deltaproteobacteria bacterium]|nr:lycopene beta-cyclase CrtY [Deltaproteobacteria bacterium]
MPAPVPQNSDLLLVGGGLQSALIALATARQEGRSVTLVEAAPRVGGNHTWCFHEGDVPDGAHSLVEPLVVRRWPGYDVAFPGHARSLALPYAAISSARLAERTEELFATTPGYTLLTGTRVATVERGGATLEDGRRLTARSVVDARGPDGFLPRGRPAYQKFLGLELELAVPTRQDRPFLMDARVPQRDGFRFLYVLPFSPTRVLVEDTCFSDGPELDVAATREEVLAYASKSGLVVSRVVREEQGLLAMPTRGLPRPPRGGALRLGYAGGWFHPTTAYSFPVALRVALAIAAAAPDAPLDEVVAALRDRHRSQFRFAAFLNRLLVSAFAPEDRWNVLARFYRLPDDTIRRFYALDLSTQDRLRILCGAPPQGISLRFALTPGVPPA